MPWVQRLDDTYWSPASGTWNSVNERWDSQLEFVKFQVVYLLPLGTWKNSFRPTHIRVTISVNTTSLQISDSDEEIIVNESSYTSGTSIEMDWTNDKDIYVFGIVNASTTAFTVTNIEFYLDTAILVQDGYRFRNDDGTESNATWIANEDININFGQDYRLRYLINNEENKAETDRRYYIEYKKSTDDYWKFITPNTTSITNEYISSDNFNDNDFNTDIWTIANWDGSGASSTVTEQNNRIELSGSTGTTQYTYWDKTIYQTIDSTSIFDVSVKITHFYQNDTSSISMGGLTCSGDDDYFNINIELYQGTKYISYNLQPGGANYSNRLYNFSLPIWFRMVSDGLKVYLYISENGTTWTLEGSGVINNEITSVGMYGLQQNTVAANKTGYIYFDDFENNEMTFPFYLKESTNITDGASTTAQLTPPSGKTTSDFDAGKIHDESNPSDAFTIGANEYTEIEWSIGINMDLVENDEEYNFRIYDLDGYNETSTTTIIILKTDIQYLYYRYNNETYTIQHYETADVGWDKSLNIRIDGSTRYIPLSTNTSHANASHIRVRIGGTTYAVLNEDSNDIPTLDNFNRSNGAIGSNWSILSGGWNVSSNTVVPTDNSNPNMAAWDDTFTDNQEAQITITTKPTINDNSSLGIFFRINTSTNNGYLLTCVPKSGTDWIRVWRVDSGVVTLLGTNIEREFNSGDRVRVRMIDDTIDIFHDSGDGWVHIGTRQDSTYSTGDTIGIYGISTTGAIDDFGARSL